MTHVVMVDYGAGNLRSVAKALDAVGADVTVTGEPGPLRDADRVVLPGVGAFGDGMAELERQGFVEPLRTLAASGTPLLGVCLGMQLLLERSEEMGKHRGLGLIPGEVIRFDDSALKVPHTGWNQILPERSCPLLEGLPEASYAYFNHGYYCQTDASVTAARTQYGVDFSSVIQRERMFGVQFHPEKSQDVGLRILANFMELA